MTMKAVSALIVASALLASPAFAGDYGSDRGGMKHGHKMMKHCDEMDECITEGLNLTPDQQTKVRAILDDSRKKREALRNETMQKMRAVLTPEQVKMVDEHRAEIMQFRAEQMKEKAERMEDRADEMKDRQEERRDRR
jgi:Spy/CpxP family protein refolding chaperone